MKTKNCIVFTLLYFVLSQHVAAQEEDPTSESARLKTIENTISALPKISGLIDLRYQYSTEEKNYSTGRNGFDVRRAYLDFRGNASKQLNYRLQLDFATSPKILDAYVEWKPLKFIGLQAGQFKTAYTLENPYSPTTLETADNSQVIGKLIADYGNNGRDIGLSVNGSFFQHKDYNLIDYKIGVLNGNNINSTDNNNTKDLFGVVLVNPLKALTISGSYYNGKYGPEATKYNRNRMGFGARYDDGKYMLRAEYITGDVGISKAKLTTAQGFYVSAGYFITRKIQPVLKYDFYQENKTSNQTSVYYVAGVNYQVLTKARIQVNYTHKTYTNGANAGSDYVMSQLVLTF